LFGEEGEVAEHGVRAIERRWFAEDGTQWQRWWRAVLPVRVFQMDRGRERVRIWNGGSAWAR
jgi:hypothetical protein